MGRVGQLLCPEDVEEILCGTGLCRRTDSSALIIRCIFINMVENIIDAKKSAERKRQHLGKRLRHPREEVVVA